MAFGPGLQVEVVPMPYVTETADIQLVLPVTVRDADGWNLFVENLSKIKVSFISPFFIYLEVKPE